LSEQENKVLSNISSFFGIVTAAKAAGAKPQPKLTAALRVMTMGNDMCFWGPNGMISKFLASARTAVTELRALVSRQATAILRLLSHLANLGGGGAAPMGIAADAPGGAPPALNLSSLPAAAAKPPPRAEPPPAPAAQAPDGSEEAGLGRRNLTSTTISQQAPDGSGGDLTLDQIRPLLRAALKIPKPRNQQPTIDGGLESQHALSAQAELRADDGSLDGELRVRVQRDGARSNRRRVP
jgi:hypothetical protein